jgi:CBS domain containing-hemolysin-like protein
VCARGRRPPAAPLDAAVSESGSSQNGPAPVPELLLNASALETLRVADVMVPRADITAVEIDTPLGELARTFADAAHSRLPIYRETLDDPVGVVHIKDVVSRLAGDETGARPEGWSHARILPEIRRPLLYVPPSMKATDLLFRMQSRRMHMALVVDEFGGTDGLVTLEDVLEELVGEIVDETDVAEEPITRVSRNEILAAGDVDLREINHHFNTAFPQLEHRSLNGYILEELGRVPETGETFEREGIHLEVLQATDTLVERVRLRRLTAPVETTETGRSAGAFRLEGQTEPDR